MSKEKPAETQPDSAHNPDDPKHVLKALTENEAMLKDQIENRIPKFASKENQPGLIKQAQRHLKEVQKDIRAHSSAS